MNRETLFKTIDKLRPDPAHGPLSLHKPLLFLYALGRFSCGEEQLPYVMARIPIKELLKRFGPERTQYRPWLPFWRLQNDGIWKVSWSGPNNAVQPGDRELIEGDAIGGFTGDLIAMLRQNTGLVTELVDRLLARFPSDQHISI